mgnify:FL=1
MFLFCSYDRIIGTMRLLLVCSANVQRSVTGAGLFGGCPGIETESAGTDPEEGRTPVSQDLIDWADIVFVMDEEGDGHASFIRSNFNVSDKKIYDLGIKDVYFTHQPELKSLIIRGVSKYVDLKPCMDKLIESIKK